MRSILFLLLGLAGFVLSGYSAQKTLAYYQTIEVVSVHVLLFAFAAFMLLLAGIANLFAAYGLTFGRVASVSGTRLSPSLVHVSGRTTSAGTIRFARNLDKESNSVPEDRQTVIFLSGFVPHSCAASSFLKSS